MMEIKEELMTIIRDGSRMSASDIHFTRHNDEVLILFRADQMRVPRKKISREFYERILAYVRFNAALDLAHPKQPQSGSLILEEEEEEEILHCRVSILPTDKFHSLVLRIINHKMGKSLENIPFFTSNVGQLQEIAKETAGLLLIGGPTGSGKTTTAYALIDYLKNILGKSVVTIEDPIEYQQEDIVQMQVNERAGMNYEVGIKEILRHDPDVIVVGEIRDAKTAAQALRAALTGHLVISTIHAKNNLGILHRLMDLGIGLSDIMQSLVGLVNQRLVKAGGERTALMEICANSDLDLILEQLAEGSILTIPYTTIDEEFLKWKSQKS